MPYEPYHNASRTLQALSLEELHVAELAFCYGLPANRDVYERLRRAVSHTSKTVFTWTWTNLHRDGFDLVVDGKGWKVVPPFNSPQ